MQSIIAPRIQGEQGVYWCAAWYALQGVLSLGASAFQDGIFTKLVLIVFGAFCVYAALGLLRALKPAWHIATFIAFVSIVLTGISIACAPGEIADNETTLFEAALDVLVLTLFILVYSCLRKPRIRTLYGVPLSYRADTPSQ